MYVCMTGGASFYRTVQHTSRPPSAMASTSSVWWLQLAGITSAFGPSLTLSAFGIWGCAFFYLCFNVFHPVGVFTSLCVCRRGEGKPILIQLVQVSTPSWLYAEGHDSIDVELKACYCHVDHMLSCEIGLGGELSDGESRSSQQITRKALVIPTLQTPVPQKIAVTFAWLHTWSLEESSLFLQVAEHAPRNKATDHQ